MAKEGAALDHRLQEQAIASGAMDKPPVCGTHTSTRLGSRGTS